MIVVCIGGCFAPIHSGHIDFIKAAKQLGDKLVVVLCQDSHQISKRGFVFMDYSNRKTVLEAIKYVDEVVPNIDTDNTMAKSLRLVKPDIFAIGGDWNEDNMPKSELESALAIGCKVIFNVGRPKRIYLEK